MPEIEEEIAIILDNTLYISDLDGTLLGDDATLSPHTVDVVNRFIEAGGLFSIATARSLNLGGKVMDPLHLKLPVCLNNGAVIYDFGKKEFLAVNRLPEDGLRKLSDLFEAENLRGFVFGLDGHTVKIFHQPLLRESERRYRESRYDAYGGHFYEVDDLAEGAASVVPEGTAAIIPFFCVVYGEPDFLADFQNQVNAIEGLQCSVYSDIYNEFFFMDIYSAAASKETGAKWIQQYCGAERVVAFGDNHNDIPMLLAADESYVTENGVEEAKAAATGVISHCDDSGVACFLTDRFGL
ncbi:MAG: HAD hydrolase family protein [Oscillospiraceae bacterium]